ncbi:class I SAM-dependent methyltransferase [Streptomyces sp. NPDC048507]|uniref:class I SAM-dependent methyltransferase n=1 Tax=Streptomyces sp. NPDC048507 TaxID=3365560 RepID=UPI003720D820
MNTHHHHHGDIGHEPASGSDIAMAQLLELDAEVLASYLAELTGRLAALAHSAPARILDLGSGPGTGSLALALAHRFPTAAVTAVDISATMLHRLLEQAAARGLADRITTLEANLDEPWDGIADRGPYDLVWAAAFLHHVVDPARTLAQAFEQLRPGGLLAVAEMDFFPLFLPEDTGIGRPGLEARLHAATNTQPPHADPSRPRPGGTGPERLRPDLPGQAALPRHRRPRRGRSGRLGHPAGRSAAARPRAPRRLDRGHHPHHLDRPPPLSRREAAPGPAPATATAPLARPR